MNELKIFSTDSFGEIRTVIVDGQIHFVALDITNILGYKNSRKATKDHCRWVTKCYVLHPQSVEKVIEVNTIPKGDVYRLIACSELPAAREFESWVFDEVIPSIDQFGAYITKPKLDELLSNPDLIIGLATQLKQMQAAQDHLKLEVRQLGQIVGELRPKANYVDTILQSKSLVNVNQIAKDYGMSARSFNKILHDFGIQYKQGEQWLLYHKYQAKDYTHSETFQIERSDGRHDVVMRTRWTQKGRLFLYDLLKQNGCVPMIEKRTA